jgi:hypothetical protein
MSAFLATPLLRRNFANASRALRGISSGSTQTGASPLVASETWPFLGLPKRLQLTSARLFNAIERVWSKKRHLNGEAQRLDYCTWDSGRGSTEKRLAGREQTTCCADDVHANTTCTSLIIRFFER